MMRQRVSLIKLLDLKMKKLLLTIFLFISVVPAQANEFRSLKLGEYCSVIEANESSLGGTPKDLWRREDGEYIYEGYYEGYESTIIYSCREGKFFKGALVIKSQGPENSISMFIHLRQHFSSEFGVPVLDTSDTNTKKEMKEQDAPDLLKYNEAIVSWKNDSLQAGLSLNDSADSKPILLYYIQLSGSK